MEIEDLKHIWRKQNEDFTPKAETELATMLRGRSRSIITRLKRNVWSEIAFTLVGAIALIFYALQLPDGYLKWTSISILILFGLYSTYYLKKLTVLNRFDSNHENLKANLEQLIVSLKGYLKFYKRSYSILYPVFFLLALLFIAIEHGATGFFHKVGRPEVYLILLPGAALFFVFSTKLTSWYLKKLYGNHLEKLERLLRDLKV